MEGGTKQELNLLITKKKKRNNDFEDDMQKSLEANSEVSHC